VVKYKSLVFFLMLLSLPAFLIIGCGTQSGQRQNVQKKDISVGTGGTGGVYQVVGTAIANLINEKLPNVRAVPEPAPALTQTARFLNSGEFTIGIISSDVAAFARNGSLIFSNEKMPKIRTLTAGHEVGMAYVVLDDSPIKSLADLKGKKVGATSTGMSLPLQELAKLYGVQPNEFEVVYITFAQQVEALKSRSIDLAVQSAYPRASALMDLTESQKIRFISGVDKMSQFLEKNPYWRPREIPANTYKGQTAPYAGAPGQYLLVGINADVSDELAYNLAKVILENTPEIAKVHPAGQEYNLEQVKKYIKENQITVPFHPGAAKYLREKGVVVDSSLVEGS